MPKRVLVVDDDPVQRRALEDTIRRFGYTVATAETGDQAVSVLRSDASGDISLILLDLAVPGSEGMAVLAALRSLPRKYPAIVQIADGKNFMATAWWMSVFPGVAIIVTGLAFSLVGDGLAELLRTKK